MRPPSIGIVLAWVLAVVCSEVARGDGGTVRLSRSEGSYRISVFTAPMPFRAGPVDISVFVQDAATGVPNVEARVTVCLTLADRSRRPIRLNATTEAATNKLLRAAVFELPEAGPWEIEVAVEGEQGSARIPFTLTAAPRLPQWPALWLWIGWPFAVILLFSAHQFLVWRRLRPLKSRR